MKHRKAKKPAGGQADQVFGEEALRALKDKVVPEYQRVHRRGSVINHARRAYVFGGDEEAFKDT